MATIILNQDIADLLVKYDRDDSIRCVISNDVDFPTPFPEGSEYVLRFYDADGGVLSEFSSSWDELNIFATIYVSAEAVNEFFVVKPSSVRLLFLLGDYSTVVASGKVQAKKFGD